MAGFWRKCRITFRWFRLAVWLLVLAAIGAFLWCNRVGVPDFLKTRLVAGLHEHGVELEFSRLRLSLVRGLVADNVRAGEGRPGGGAVLAARFVQLEPGFAALLHGRIELHGLLLRDGVFTLPLSPTNTLTFTNLAAGLRFGTGDFWALEQFRAGLAGMQISIRGGLAHASEARGWKLFSGGGDRGALVANLDKFCTALKQIHFAGEPQLRFSLSGDARDIHSVAVHLDANADGVRTPWFEAKKFQAAATLTAPAAAPTENGPALGFWTNLQPFRLEWALGIAALHTPQLDAEAIACGGTWAMPVLAVTNFSARLGGEPLAASAALDVPSRRLVFTNHSELDLHLLAPLLPDAARAQLAEIAWTRPPVLRAEGALVLPPWANPPAGWTAGLESNLVLQGEFAFTNAAVAGVPVDRVRAGFGFTNADWSVAGLEIVQGRTQLFLDGTGNQETRDFRCHLAGALDANSVRPFLTASNAAAGFGILDAREPLALDLQLSGNLLKAEGLAASGRVALTNFSVRGQQIGWVASQMSYLGGVLHFFQPELQRANGAQRMTADEVALDFTARMISFANGFSTMDPAVLTAAIGPKTAHWLEPYHFLRPPVARVNGHLPLHNMNGPKETEGTDMRFDVVEPVPFHWLKLDTPALTGTIRWLGPELVLTNLTAELYGGSGTGWVYLDFRPPHPGADYCLAVAVTNVDLRRLAAQTASATNRLEGILAGRLVVTSASTESLDSWNGYGTARLRDGLLWDIPIFGILSPLLNTFSAGLGNSRATEASANFLITNGVISSDSLDIHASFMRLNYTGTVDMKQNVDARVTARLLHDVWVVGPIVSTALWPVSKIFECKVTGNLSEPKATPMYFPKILLAPLHPIRSLEELFTPSSAGGTNAPPRNSP